LGPDDAIYTVVKRSEPGSRTPLEAKFTRHAQQSLEPVLVEADPPAVCIGGLAHAIGAKRPSFS